MNMCLFSKENIHFDNPLLSILCLGQQTCQVSSKNMRRKISIFCATIACTNMNQLSYSEVKNPLRLPRKLPMPLVAIHILCRMKSGRWIGVARISRPKWYIRLFRARLSVQYLRASAPKSY